MAAVGDAVKPRLVAGQPPYAFGQVEGAALAHPMAEEIKPEPGIAEIDEMRAGVGQRNDAGPVLHQRLDPFVDGVEEAADQPGVEIFLEAEIEQCVERVAPLLARDVGDRAVGEPGVLRLHRRRDDDALPVALEHGAGLRLAQVGPERVAEARVAEYRFQLLAVIGLDRVEGRVAVERIGAGQGEIERQRLAGDLDVELVAAGLGGGAGVEHAERPIRDTARCKAPGRCS